METTRVRETKAQKKRYRADGTLKRHLDGGSRRRQNQLDRIYARDLGVCRWCRKSISREESSRDHVVRVREISSQNECRSDDNIVLSCKPCNQMRD